VELIFSTIIIAQHTVVHLLVDCTM